MPRAAFSVLGVLAPPMVVAVEEGVPLRILLLFLQVVADVDMREACEVCLLLLPLDLVGVVGVIIQMAEESCLLLWSDHQHARVGAPFAALELTHLLQEVLGEEEEEDLLEEASGDSDKRLLHQGNNHLEVVGGGERKIEEREWREEEEEGVVIGGQIEVLVDLPLPLVEEGVQRCPCEVEEGEDRVVVVVEAEVAEAVMARGVGSCRRVVEG